MNRLDTRSCRHERLTVASPGESVCQCFKPVPVPSAGEIARTEPGYPFSPWVEDECCRSQLA